MKNDKRLSKEEAMNNQPPFNEEEFIACEEAFNEGEKLEKEKEEAIENASNEPPNYENYLDAREEVLIEMDKIQNQKLTEKIEKVLNQKFDENQLDKLNKTVQARNRKRKLEKLEPSIFYRGVFRFHARTSKGYIHKNPDNSWQNAVNLYRDFLGSTFNTSKIEYDEEFKDIDNYLIDLYNID